MSAVVISSISLQTTCV